MNFLFYSTKARPCLPRRGGTAAQDYVIAHIVWGARLIPKKEKIATEDLKRRR